MGVSKSARLVDDRLASAGRRVGPGPLAVEEAIAHAERAKATRCSAHTLMTVHAVRLDQGAEVPGPERRLSVHSGWALAFSRGLITVRSSPDFDTEEVVRRWDEKPDLLKHGVGALVRCLPVAGAGPRHNEYDVVEFVRQNCSQGFGWLAGEVQ